MNSTVPGIFRFAKYLVVILIFPVISMLNSCREDTGDTGANVLPNSDLISAYHSDTTTVVTSMYFKDTVVTFGPEPTYAATLSDMLGSYNDPLFGQFKASIYAQVLTPANTTTMPWNGQDVLGNDTGVVDSAVLILPYYIPSIGGSYYGNLDPQTFVVYQLDNVINQYNSAGSGVSYFCDTSIKYNPTPIGIQQWAPPNPGLQDTAIRIKLSSKWLKKILDSLGTGASSYYFSNMDSLVRGMYVTVSNPLQLPGQGGVVYVNLVNAFAGVYFYWHGIAAPKNEITPFWFLFGGTCFNHFDHNYATAPFYTPHFSAKNTHDSISANELVYVQSAGGPVGRINFPYLKNWSKMNPVVINKAELDMYVVPEDAGNPFVPPPQLELFGTDSNWTPDELPDWSQPYQGSLASYYPSYPYNYSFIITDYIQHVIDGKIIDRGLFLTPNYNATTANRVVIYGPKYGTPQSTTRMRLTLYYTPLQVQTKKKR
jgi:hypothetical protein